MDGLKQNNNVPYFVKKLDVCNKSALIVSPAGDKVLPLSHSVRVNRTDFVKLLYVLKYAHGLSICHCDVKPNNIFKDQNGRIILSDWSSVATTGVSEPWARTSSFTKSITSTIRLGTEHTLAWSASNVTTMV